MLRAVVGCFAVFVAAALSHPDVFGQQRWTVVADLRIGSVDDDRAALTEVRSVALAADGSVYVTQHQENLIRVFDDRGRLLRTIGRRGSGPGEFQALGPIEIRGDTVFAMDLSLQRVSAFTRSGTHIRTSRVVSPPTETFRPAGPVGMLSDGSLLAQPTVSMNLDAGDSAYAVPVYILDRTGSTLGTLTNLIQVPQTQVIKLPNVPNGHLFTRKPIAFRSMFATAPNGASIVIVHQPEVKGAQASGTFRVFRLSSPHDTVFARTFRYKPRPVPRQVVDSLVSARISAWQAIPRTISVNDAARSLRESIPEYQPPISRVLVTDDGLTWMRREEFGPSESEWIVLDPKGAFVATVHIPRDVVVHRVVRDQLWGSVRGEFDVPFLVRYRVVRTNQP